LLYYCRTRSSSGRAKIEPKDYKYRAFISYSHKDEKWAAWLHRSLETFRVPKYLVGESTSMGIVPERMGKVFRDREELSSSHSLGAELTQALEDSACQIVICSPNAVNSHWTNEEILTYKRLDRENRVFCLIVDGEPGTDAECFPPAVRFQMGADGALSDRPAEPIAADARLHGDGRQNAKLKLISGMLGVGFDALKQRENQRRHKRMLMVTAAAVAGMVITSGLATMAVLARNEANVQRQRAEIDAETARQTTQFMVGLFEVSDPSESLGNSITAREILDKGAARIENELTDQPAIQATLMDTMGTVYTSLGLYAPAASLVNQSLQKRSALHGTEHVEVASSLNHLGKVQTLQADYEQAEANLRGALSVRRKLLGDGSPDVAETLEELAYVLTRRGEYAQAEPLIRESLAIRRAALGDRHPEVAASLEVLALNLFDQGDFESPVPLLQEAVAMQRELHAGPHPDLAEVLNNLGYVYLESGEFDLAEDLFIEALAMKRTLLGDEHPEIAVGISNVAYVLHVKGDYAAAEPMYMQLIAMQERLLGEDHPDVAASMNNLAFLYHDQGNQSAALAMASESLAIKRRTLGDEHPEVAHGLNAVAVWTMEGGDYGTAEGMLRESLAMNSKMLGPDHPDTAGSMSLLASCLVIGTQYAEARSLADRAREIYTGALTEHHWRTALATNTEGAAIAGLRNFAEAEPLLLGSQELLRNDPAAPGIYVAEATRRVARLYTDWGKPEKAALYLQ
jgi:tetratricopeptide (TPR) repeat protein